MWVCNESVYYNNNIHRFLQLFVFLEFMTIKQNIVIMNLMKYVKFQDIVNFFKN